MNIDLIVYSNNTVFHDDMVRHSMQLLFDTLNRRKRVFLILDEFDLSKHESYLNDNFDEVVYAPSSTFSLSGIETLLKKYSVFNVVCMFNLIHGDRKTYETKLISEPKEKEAYILNVLELIVSKCNSNAGICHQFSHDPQEARIFEIIKTKPRSYYYHFIHSLQHGVLDKIDNVVNTFTTYPFSKNVSSENNKSIDFVFGLSAYDEYRKSILPEFIKLKDEYECVYYSFYDDNKTHVDTRIPYSEYLKKLYSAKSTFCVPAYSKDTFSIHRLIECISFNCIPIIDVNSNITVIDQELRSVLISNGLIVSSKYTELKDAIVMISRDYERILNEIKNTRYVKLSLNNNTFHKKFITYFI